MAEPFRGEEDPFQRLLREASLGTALFDLSGAIDECNPALVTMLGSTAEELRGTSVLELAHPMYRHQLAKLLQELLAGKREEAQTEAGLCRENGTLHWSRIALYLARTRHGDPDYGIAIFEQLPSEHRVLETIHQMATTDDLTGLYNRRGFHLLAEQQWRIAARKQWDLALLYVDLNGLKKINDAHGHAVGDDAIRKTGEVLRAACRDSDIVARLGGDEFVVLMVEAGDVGVERVRARVQHALANHNTWGDRPYRLSVSLGVSRYVAGEVRSLDEMLSEADRRMYEEKRKGR